MTASRRLRFFHRISAIAFSTFLILHVANHLAALAGQGAHIEMMAALRPLYRNALTEPLILALAAWQAASGLILLWRARHAERDMLSWLQQLSGIYLSLFIFVHICAVLAGRAVFGLDTNFRFAAAGFHVGNWIWFFVPYYFLALFSLFAHVGCGIYWNLPGSRPGVRKVALTAMLIAGTIIATSVVLALAGALYPVDIPSAYRATYGS